MAQSIVRFEWSTVSDAFFNLVELAMSEPLYLAIGFVVVLIAGKMVFSNRQI